MAVDFYTQNYCSSYASKFFSGGKLDEAKIKEYGRKFGIDINDLTGKESISDLAKIIYNKQIKDKFNGTDPISEIKKTNSIFQVNSSLKNQDFDTQKNINESSNVKNLNIIS